MNHAVLIIGQSGTGKSTAIRTLDPTNTFIINVLDKPLPFKGFKNKYKNIKQDETGNYYSSDSWVNIIKALEHIDKNRPDIKTVIIDDWQYILANEFMHRSSERGYDKFSDLAMHGWSIMNKAMALRDDLTCFLLAHSDIDPTGRAKLKTVGKLLDEKITIEGMFTVVLHSRVIDGRYLFQTQATDEYLAKSPLGMFEQEHINNDLNEVKKAITDYYNDED